MRGEYDSLRAIAILYNCRSNELVEYSRIGSGFSAKEFAMSLEQLEERVSALEKAYEAMKPENEEITSRASVTTGSKTDYAEPEFIEGAEYDLVLDVPAENVAILSATFRFVEEEEKGVALSDAEWASLQLEDDDE